MQGVCVPWSPGEPSAREKHKQHCPLWHRRRPHSSEKHRERLSKTEFWCSRPNLSANLRNDNVKQTSDRRPRGTITAAAPHRAAFVRNGQIYRRNNPGGEGVAFESNTFPTVPLLLLFAPALFSAPSLPHTYQRSRKQLHAGECGSASGGGLARSPTLMLYIQLAVSAVMTPGHLFHERKELLSNITGTESVQSLINTFIGLNIIMNIVPPEHFLVKVEPVCMNPVTRVLVFRIIYRNGPRCVNCCLRVPPGFIGDVS